MARQRPRVNAYPITKMPLKRARYRTVATVYQGSGSSVPLSTRMMIMKEAQPTALTTALTETSPRRRRCGPRHWCDGGRP